MTPGPRSPSRTYRSLILELAGTGASSRQIAEQIGDGVSRNVVIGICHRAGIGVGNRNASAGSKRGWITRKAGTMVARTQAPIVEDASRDPADIWPDRYSCIWPLGDPREKDFRFCCSRRETDRRYCNAHVAIAFRTRDQEGGL